MDCLLDGLVGGLVVSFYDSQNMYSKNVEGALWRQIATANSLVSLVISQDYEYH